MFAPTHASEATNAASRHRSPPRLSDAARAHGLTPRMLGVLACAVATPGLPAKEVTRRLRFEKTAVCYATAKLERMGLLSQQRDPADLRRICIHATEAGLALLRTVTLTAAWPTTPGPQPLAEPQDSILKEAA